MNKMWKWCEIVKSHYFHIFVILFSYFFHIFGPGTRAPKCENNMKIIWKTYENNVICQVHIIFTFYSYYFHICITFLGSGPRSGLQKSYFCHIPGHIFFILFSYFCENLVFQPLHTEFLLKPCIVCRSESEQKPPSFAWRMLLLLAVLIVLHVGAASRSSVRLPGPLSSSWKAFSSSLTTEAANQPF